MINPVNTNDSLLSSLGPVEVSNKLDMKPIHHPVLSFDLKFLGVLRFTIDEGHDADLH